MEILRLRVYRDFFLMPFLQRKWYDFTEISYLSHKISVNFTQNLQEKYQVYIHILWDLSTENVLKFTDFLRSYEISVNARIYKVRNLQGNVDILQRFN